MSCSSVRSFLFNISCCMTLLNNIPYLDLFQDRNTVLEPDLGTGAIITFFYYYYYFFLKEEIFPSKQCVNTVRMDIHSSSVFQVWRPVPNRGYSLHLLHSDAVYFSHASYICVTLLFLLQGFSFFCEFNTHSVLVTRLDLIQKCLISDKHRTRNVWDVYLFQNQCSASCWEQERC